MVLAQSSQNLLHAKTVHYGYTVKSLNLLGTKFRGLTMIDMLVDTWICGFQIIY